MKHVICGFTVGMIINMENVSDEKCNLCNSVHSRKNLRKKNEICYLWTMIKVYLTDCCVAGYPCIAEWGVRPLHCIHCSSNYSHLAGGTPCLCHPVSVLSVSLYIH